MCLTLDIPCLLVRQDAQISHLDQMIFHQRYPFKWQGLAYFLSYLLVSD
jgi:hypothetical protein